MPLRIMNSLNTRVNPSYYEASILDSAAVRHIVAFGCPQGENDRQFERQFWLSHCQTD